MRRTDDYAEKMGGFEDWRFPDVYDWLAVYCQLELGPYRADFAFVEPVTGDTLAIVEIDERAHRYNWPGDLVRDRFFTMQRIAVVRFTEDEVRLDAERCAFTAAWFAQWLCSEHGLRDFYDQTISTLDHELAQAREALDAVIPDGEPGDLVTH